MKNKFRIILGAGFLCLAFFAMPHQSHAATDTWIGNGLGNGALWSVGSNWSGGTVPAPGDDVVFGSSDVATATVDIATANLNSITIGPGYTGTITVNSNASLNYSYNYYYGVFTQNSGTLIDNGSLSGNEWTSGTVINGGTFTVGATGSLGGNFQQTGGTFNGGPGSIGFWIIILNGGVFNAPAGTLSSEVFQNGGTAVFNADGGTVSWWYASTLNATTTFYNVSGNIAGGTGAITVQGTLTVSYDLCNNNTITALGPVVLQAGGSCAAATLVLAGTGTQIVTGTSTLGAYGLPNVTVNNPGGTVVIQGGITIAGTFNIASGTISLGTSTITFAPNTQASIIAKSPLTLTNVGFAICSGNTSPYLIIPTSTIVNVTNSFTLMGTCGFMAPAYFAGGGQFAVQGNIIDTSQATGLWTNTFYQYTSPLVINGTGTQYIYATSTGAGVGAMPWPLQINKTNGSTLNLVGTINLLDMNGGGWNYIAGNVNAGTSTVAFVGGYSYCGGGTAMLNGNTQFNNLEIFGDFCNAPITVSTTTTPIVNGTFIITANNRSPQATYIPAINGGTIQITGNIQATPFGALVGGSGGGTATLAITGTSTQTFTNQLGTSWQLPQFLINKPQPAFSVVNNMSSNFTKYEATALLGYGSFLLGSTTIQDGEFWIPSSTLFSSTSLSLAGNLTIGSTGLLGVYQVSSTIASAGTSAITITNNGMVHIDAPQMGCGQAPTIALTGTASSPLNWNGAGQYIVRYVTASHQGGTASITAINSTGDGTNGSNWTFKTSQPPPQLIQLANGIGMYPTGPMFVQTPWGVRPGDMIVVALLGDGYSLPAPTDNAGNTYHLVTSTVSTISGVSSYLSLYYAKNVSDTPPFYVVTNGTQNQGVNMEVLDYAGITPSSTLDTFSANASVGTTTQYLNSGYVNTTVPDDLFVAVGGGQNCQSQMGNIWSPFTTEVASSPQCQTYTAPGLEVGDFVTSTPQYLQSTMYSMETEILAAFHAATIQTYPPLGVLDSATFDMRAPASLNSLTWRGTIPAGASTNSVSFQIAVSNNSTGPWNFVGPDGTANTFFSGNSGTQISLQSCTLVSSCYSIFSNYRYFRYRVMLTSNGMTTPTVTSVVVNWSL